MLAVRKIEKSAQNGNYFGIFGQGNANIITGGDALAQILTHQILTVRGELKTRTDYGVDWFNQKDPNNVKTIFDAQIRNIIISNPYVVQIISFNSTYDPNLSLYTLRTELVTTEGRLELSL